jgi:hypothetical protein
VDTSQKKVEKRTPKNPFDYKQGLFNVECVIAKRSAREHGVEYQIRWCDYPDPNDDLWEPLKNLAWSEYMVAEFERKWPGEYAEQTQETLNAQATKKQAIAAQAADARFSMVMEEVDNTTVDMTWTKKTA